MCHFSQKNNPKQRFMTSHQETGKNHLDFWIELWIEMVYISVPNFEVIRFSKTVLRGMAEGCAESHVPDLKKPGLFRVKVRRLMRHLLLSQKPYWYK